MGGASTVRPAPAGGNVPAAPGDAGHAPARVAPAPVVPSLRRPRHACVTFMDSVTTPASAGPALAPPARPVAALAPTRVKVSGPLHAVRLPDACAACGTPARGTLRVEKMFRRTSDDSPTRTFFNVLDVPFCDGCRAAHARELAPVDPAVLRRLRWRFALRLLPYVIPLGVIFWMIPVVLIPFARSLTSDQLGLRTASGEWNWGLAIAGGVLAFFGFCLLAFLTLVNRARHDLVAPYAGDADDLYVRRERVLLGPNAVFLGPPTSVLAAANYTDDASELFEPEWRTFTFRDPVFAAQFAALNADRLWSAKKPRARWARKARKILFTLFLIVVGVLWVLDLWQG